MFRVNKLLVPQRVASSASRYLSSQGEKLVAPPLVYISGEEYSRYAGELYMNEWIKPYVDTSKWEFYDLSCVSRDKTDDQVLKDCVKAGKRLGAIYKEPTITPTEEQAKQFGLKKAWGSPNGLMRKGWNGISISRYGTCIIIIIIIIIIIFIFIAFIFITIIITVTTSYHYYYHFYCLCTKYADIL